MWEWKLLLPVRSSKCGEDEAAVFQIPRVVRHIARAADSRESLQTIFLLASIFEEIPPSGIMSPCPARSLNTGLSWYKISPVSYLWQPSMQ